MNRKIYNLSCVLLLLFISCHEKKISLIGEELNVDYSPVLAETQGVSTDAIMSGDFSYLNVFLNSNHLNEFNDITKSDLADKMFEEHIRAK